VLIEPQVLFISILEGFVCFFEMDNTLDTRLAGSQATVNNAIYPFLPLLSLVNLLHSIQLAALRSHALGTPLLVISSRFIQSLTQIKRRQVQKQ